MRKGKLLFGLVTLVTIYSCQNKPQEDDNRFRGMWRLDKFESFDSISNKWVDDTTFMDYTGYILYDGKGHVGVHLTPKGYKDFNTMKNIDSLDIDQLKALVKFYKSNFVYFGDYTLVNDSTIEHKRLSATEPQNWGTTLTRFFSFNKDTLVLRLSGKKTRVRWIKL